MNQRTMAKLLMEAEEWNQKTPFGTPVVLRLDDGSEFRTKTRSGAFVIPSGQILVQVEGKAGGYLLSRVRHDTAGKVAP